MKRRRLPMLLALSIASSILVGPASAHHSLSTAYDNARRVTIDAVVREFHFVNPHPYVLVEERRGGSVATWKLELDNRGELLGIGMTADTFKPGDRVIVSGAPGRREATILYVRELDRPADGFHYEQFSATPRISRKTAPVSP